MNFLRCFVLLAALWAAPVLSRAAENRYDLAGRLLMPFVNVFATTTANPQRALRLTGRLEQLTGAPPELVGSRAELAVEYPDKLRLRAPVLGENVTICRRGQTVWAFPGTKIEALLNAARAAKKLPKLDKKYRLEPFALPIPQRQLVFLPALFQIKEIGQEELGGEPCRVLDFFLMPELAKSLKASGWAARVWIRRDATPARVSFAREDWNVVVRLEQVEFAELLPGQTWEPTSEEAADLLQLDGSRYHQLLEAMTQ